jgi:hypothetical protein
MYSKINIILSSCSMPFLSSSSSFFRVHLEHKVFRKTFYVSSYCLVQHPCFSSVQFSKNTCLSSNKLLIENGQPYLGIVNNLIFVNRYSIFNSSPLPIFSFSLLFLYVLCSSIFNVFRYSLRSLCELFNPLCDLCITLYILHLWLEN